MCASRASQSISDPAGLPTSTQDQLNELSTPQLRVFLKGYPGVWQSDSDRAQNRPEPPAEKPLPPGARTIPLVPPSEIHLGEMSVREAIAHIQAITGRIAGADIVEFNPAQDHTQITAMVAAKLLKEILGQMIGG